MARGKLWTRKELLVAMNLYCKLPFGQLHHRNPLIIDVAKTLHRTPSSLAMKLCNFASLDPVQVARGIRGLSGASNADQEIWQEFHDDWEELAVKSENLLAGLLPKSTKRRGGKARRGRTPPQKTEAQTSVRARRGQEFFRQTVLASYGNRCCITGNPVIELLVASHILPWSGHPRERMNPRNGLSLAATHDVAFDRGLITLDENNRLVLSKYLSEYETDGAIRAEFARFGGKKIRLSDKFAPEPRFLEYHREHIFRG